MKLNQTIKTLLHRKIKWALALAAGCLWSSSLIAGTLTWNWSFTNSYNTDTGSGTITTADTITTNGVGFYGPYTGYLITGITGTWDSNTIASLSPIGTDRSDNFLTGASRPQLDDHGFAFTIANDPSHYIVIYFNNNAYGIYKSDGSAHNYGTSTFTATLVQPPLVISSVNLSGADVMLTVANGQSGKTYITLTSADLITWTPVATNELSADGSFSITVTNGVNSSPSQAFYRLQVQ